MAVTELGFDGLERSRSEDAQQVSACACVMTLVVPVLRDSLLCIGHSLPSAQHAIRASGVGAHPAHTAAFPIVTNTVRARADSRRLKLRTCLGCWTHTRVSTADGARTRTMQRLDRALHASEPAPRAIFVHYSLSHTRRTQEVDASTC
jgi:hypothetical protein